MLMEEDSPLALEEEDIDSHVLAAPYSRVQATMCLAKNLWGLVVLVAHSVVGRLGKSDNPSSIECSSGIGSGDLLVRPDILFCAAGNALHLELDVTPDQSICEILTTCDRSSVVPKLVALLLGKSCGCRI